MSWEYQNDHGDFVKFGASHIKEIETGWNKRGAHPTCGIVIGTQTYTVDFTNMTQTNTHTHKVRALRRRGGPRDDDADCTGQWQWHDHKRNIFVDYIPEVNALIEKAFQNDELHTAVRVPLNAHDTKQFEIHFGHHHQKNNENGKTRAIRRVPKKKIESGQRRTRSPDQAAKAVPTTPGHASKAAAAAAASNSNTTASAADQNLTIANWSRIHDSVLFLNADPQNKVTPNFVRTTAAAGGARKKTIKVAAFDMDDTLIMPKSGAKFPKSAQDWQILAPVVTQKLSDACKKEGYVIVIVSNQLGIKNDPSKARQIQEKIITLNGVFGVPIYAIIATLDDKYRKPRLPLWDLLDSEMKKCLGMTHADPIIDRADSFYCGDAAGRTNFKTFAGRDKDFSCSDRKFAYNVGLKFLTPEEYFLNRDMSKVDFGWDGVGPEEIASLDPGKLPPQTAFLPSPPQPQDFVLMVGMPGCGKSSFARRYFVSNGYVHINRDTLKTMKKCQDAAVAAMQAGKSVVIDNTNPSADDRKEFISIAKQFKVKPRCVVMQTTRAMAEHLNGYRHAFEGQDHIPGIAYNIYLKKFEQPTLSEGFSEIVRGYVMIDSSNMDAETKKHLLAL